jgi:hypothetical protein
MWWSLSGHKWRHNMAHKSCILDRQGYMHARACTSLGARTHITRKQICNIYCFCNATRERASVLLYTYIVCLVHPDNVTKTVPSACLTSSQASSLRLCLVPWRGPVCRETLVFLMFRRSDEHDYMTLRGRNGFMNAIRELCLHSNDLSSHGRFLWTALKTEMPNDFDVKVLTGSHRWFGYCTSLLVHPEICKFPADSTAESELRKV